LDKLVFVRNRIHLEIHSTPGQEDQMLAADPDVKVASEPQPETAEICVREKIDEIIDGYLGKPGALIPILQMTQSLLGYLPDEALKQIAHRLGKSFSEVAAVVSFYSFFSRHPQGKHQIRVCLGTACYVRGSKEVLQELKHELGIDIGESTQDRCFSLEVGRCFGACGLAPVTMVGVDVHQRVTPARIRKMIQEYREAETTDPDFEIDHIDGKGAVS